jgi:hypothetical protein
MHSRLNEKLYTAEKLESGTPENVANVIRVAKDVARVAYLEREDTPAPTSPVGALMLRILAKNPRIDLEGARAEAHELLNRVAGKRVYRVPPVLTEEELAARRMARRARFVRRKHPRDCLERCVEPLETRISSVTCPTESAPSYPPSLILVSWFDSPSEFASCFRIRGTGIFLYLVMRRKYGGRGNVSVRIW